MQLGGGGWDRASENATKLSSLTKIQPFYWTNSRRPLVNFQSPEKVDVDHFDEWSSCFCGGAGFWSPYSILEVLLSRRNVYNLYFSSDETDKLSCSICVPVSGVFEWPSFHWGVAGTTALCRSSIQGLPYRYLGLHPLSWEPLYTETSIWEPATALAHFNYYFGSCYSFWGPWKFPLLFCKLSAPFKR